MRSSSAVHGAPVVSPATRRSLALGAVACAQGAGALADAHSALVARIENLLPVFQR